MKKPKIIDTVFFYDELDMLTFRLTELNEHVNHFIIMESGIDFKGNSKPLFFKENEHLFEKWKDKITYLSFNELSSYELDVLDKTIIKFNLPITNFVKEVNRDNIQLYFLTHLYNHLISSDLYVEDIIMVSDVDEIPDLDKIPVIVNKVVFSPVLLRQKNFIWSTKFINPNPKLGTVCCQFTSLITSPSLFLMSYFKRKSSSLLRFEIVDSGYHLSHFYDLDKTLNKMKLIRETQDVEIIRHCWDNLTTIPENGNDRVYSLTEYFGELPKNISLLKNQPIGRETPKSHLVIINSDIDTVKTKFEDYTDFVYLINFTNNPQVSSKIKLTDKITQYNILIPNSKYYDILISENTLENFQKMFRINEIKKIVSVDLPMMMDLFTFFNGENPEKTLTIPWSELKEGFVYDKICEIL
jgi:beta-1,4-mannosyl-glycoprotein beta-1,4-N-acetylglucosaminyltransferase